MGEGEYPKISGERLRQLRMSRGLTLGRLGLASGIPSDRLNELEEGGGTLEEDTIEELADVLDVDPSDLLAD